MRPVVALAAATLVLAACSTTDAPRTAEPSPTYTTGAPSGATDPTGTTSPSGGPRRGAAEVTATIAEGLSVPWGVAFLPDGSAVVTERDTARVLLLRPRGDGWRVSEAGTVEEADPAVEGGLLGVAVSPSYDEDRTVFIYVTTATDNRIVRATLDDGRLGRPEPVLTGIPKGPIHDGGRLAFGPDGHLYASTGETGVREIAQDPDSLGGKILRITPDGEPAPGNPDPGSPVWSLGHRNVQGLAWDERGRLWASEFGDSTWDELNLVEPGGNYGWPMVEGRAADNPGVPADGLLDPALVWRTDRASPSGLAYADAALWLGALRGARLWRVTFDEAGEPSADDFFVGDHGRLRTVVAAPDGTLWVTTSNRDGRGTPSEEDDRILQVTP